MFTVDGWSAAATTTVTAAFLIKRALSVTKARVLADVTSGDVRARAGP